MKANFSFLYPDGDHLYPALDADSHATMLAKYESVCPCPSIRRPAIQDFSLLPGFLVGDYYRVDVVGKEFIWMNDSFPKDKYKWYLWYESIFLVPEEMATFLILKWK